jgi:hypothetical protein
MNKTELLDTLRAFAAKRPCLDFSDYGDAQTYRQESRAITRDLHNARELIRAVELSSITAEQIIRASSSAFSGRLTIGETESGYKLDYCTGQYFPTEYRKAVCAVLSAALWDYYRTDIPKDTDHAGDYLRATFRRNFSRAVYRGYFN